ncbi:hypothetical protein [Eubacterium sp.]
MKKIIYINLALILLLTACTHKQVVKTEEQTSTIKEISELDERETLINEIKKFAFSDEIIQADESERMDKLEKFLDSFIDKGEIQTYKIEMKSSKPNIWIKYKDDSEFVVLLEEFSSNEN